MEKIKNRFTGKTMCDGMSLQEVLESHKKWLMSEEGGSRAELSDADLSGADLSLADLSGADLPLANLCGANLCGADLSLAYLYRADLSDAYLSGADLSDAELSGAKLYGADLSGADLSGAYLYGADLSGGFVKAYGYNFTKLPVMILDKYSIEIWQGLMKIGCEVHTLEEWDKFTQKQIIEMKGKGAAKWWKKWKPALFAIAEAAELTELSLETDNDPQT